MVRQENVDWKCLVDAKAKVGESPTWVGEQSALYWVDVYGPALHRTEFPTGRTTSWPMDKLIGSFALCGDDYDVLVALENGLFRFNLRSGLKTLLQPVTYEIDNYRYNDGKADPSGRFWVGTARRPTSKEPDGGGAFYRFDERGLARLIEGTTVANGLAWSPDGGTMYIADRPNWQILAFDYDIETGEPSNRRTFAAVPEGEIPDGATVDSDGGYWIAMHGGGRILRFRPDGTLERDLKAPTQFPTMVTFGGPDLKTLFVTTATIGYARGNAGESGGGIFYAELDKKGVVFQRFLRAPSTGI